MRHKIIMEGFAFRLRPVSDIDAEMIVELRSNPKRNQFLHVSSGSLKDQLAWLARYYERLGDYYYVIERRSNGESEGVISLYNIHFESRSGEWGRWILKPGSLSAVESAYLIYRVAFEKIQLESVYCRTVADNKKVVSFHDTCGLSKRRLLKQYYEIGGSKYDAIEHCVDRAIWTDIKPRLEKLSKLTARRVDCD